MLLCHRVCWENKSAENKGAIRRRCSRGVFELCSKHGSYWKLNGNGVYELLKLNMMVTTMDK